MAPAAPFPANTDLWLPLSTLPRLAGQPREARTLSVFGRVVRGASVPAVAAEVQASFSAWTREYQPQYRGIRAEIEPINVRFFGRVTDVVWLAFIAMGLLVLLIACANVANLLLMRATTRTQEIAVRTSLGATRWTIVRQLLLESACIGALGAFAGVLLAWLGLRAFVAMIPAETLANFRIAMDLRVMSAAIVATIGSVFLFGVAPAVHVSRSNLSAVLNEHSRTTTGGISTRRWTLAFLIVEFALTLVLVANVVLDMRVAGAARRAEYAFDSEQVLTMWVTLPNQPYDTPQSRARFFDTMQEHLASMPSVSAAALASALPHAGGLMQEMVVAGRTAGAAPAPVVTVAVGDSYFDVLGLPVSQGRALVADDSTPGQEAAVVSQRFADAYFSGSNPTGQLMRLSAPGATSTLGPWIRIVGVVPTVRQQGEATNPDPVVYLPYRLSPPPSTAIVVRATGDPGVVTSLARERLHQIDPSLPLYRVMSLDDAINAAEWNGRVSTALLRGIGIVAVILALLGMYTVVSYAVTLRRRELGIRLALGARPRQIGALVLRRALVQLAIGVAAGIICVVAFDRFLTGAGARFRITDVMILGPTIAAMASITLLTCLIPSWRAARTNPLDTLRVE